MTSTMCLFSASGRSENVGPKTTETPCENFLYGIQGGPPGRSHRQLGAHAYAPATAAPTPVGWRENAQICRAAIDVRQSPGDHPRGVHAPAAELSRAGQNPSRPSVTVGQPHPPSCLAEVHTKTTLTEPARPRRWQRSEAWTRVARTVDAQVRALLTYVRRHQLETTATFTNQAAHRASQLHRGQRRRQRSRSSALRAAESLVRDLA